jgi:Uma2 family endonuclease
MVQLRYMTSEELAEQPLDNKRTELVRGRLVVREPAKAEHGRIAAQMLIDIGIYLREHPIGTVYAAETGFTLARSPDTVRAPDVAYIRADRTPREPVIGFDEIAPDLVVEVLSPGDRARMVRTKVAHWLQAGTLLVWVIDPRKRCAQVFRADGSAITLTGADTLDGENVLPGFAVSVASILTA